MHTGHVRQLTAPAQAKLRELFKLIITHFVDVTALGFAAPAWDDEEAVARVESVVMASASRSSSHHLGFIASSLRRWLKFCGENSFDAGMPSPKTLALFLRSVANGGPTAACSMFQALSWCNKHCGAQFPLQHWLVQPFKNHSPGHKPSQAPELQPWEFINLIAVVRELTGSVQVAGLFVLSAAVSCIRFAHFQRSKLVQLHPGPPPWLEFLCTQGKRRVKGSRPPYNWALPEVSFQDFSLVHSLHSYLTSCHPPGAEFLWPALSLRASELWQLCEETGFVASKRMSRSQFMELFRGFLCRCLVQPDQASRAGFNRLRRFLPTGAHALQFSDAEAQAIGSWVEIPGGSRGSGSTPVASNPMSRHYAGDKIRSSWRAKQRVIDAVLRDFRRGTWPREANTSLLKPGCFCWSQVQASPSAPEVVGPQLADVATSALPLCDDDDSSSEAVSVASGASSVLSEVSSGLDDLEWFVQGHKRHVVQELDPLHRKVPWCRESAFQQDPSAVGSGLDQSAFEDWCSRCLQRMPRQQAQSIRAFFSRAQ